MIDHTAYLLAARNRARALVVATTGLITLSATANGYARAAGSFWDDGFWRGMELVPSGFSSNTARVITDVTPLTITVNGTVPVQAAAAGRSLTVGLPSTRLWEDELTTAPITPGVPYVEEAYIDGPAPRQVTLGPNGELEATPTYVLNINVASPNGLTASRYTNALAQLFTPRTDMTLANGDVLRVPFDQGGYASQLQRGQPGFAVKVFRVPLWVRTPNPI